MRLSTDGRMGDLGPGGKETEGEMVWPDNNGRDGMSTGVVQVGRGRDVEELMSLCLRLSFVVRGGGLPWDRIGRTGRSEKEAERGMPVEGQWRSITG